jgi:hypothetical protein
MDIIAGIIIALIVIAEAERHSAKPTPQRYSVVSHPSHIGKD